jgi:hypothetical protein
MRIILVGVLSVSSISCGQFVTLDSITSNHSLSEGTLELGRVTLEFSKKPSITVVDKGTVHVTRKEVEIVCTDVLCTNLDKKSIRVHEEIPYTVHILPVPNAKKVICKMYFDPYKVSIAVDEFMDTVQGVSLLIRLYDQDLLNRLDHSTDSILRIL